MTTTTREIHLAARPSGWPTPDDFRLVEAELPDPGPGEVLVRNTFLSVDPYMRGRMNDVKSYVPPFRLDAPDGRRRGGRGRGLRATSPLAVGDTVLHQARLARARAAAGRGRASRRRRRPSRPRPTSACSACPGSRRTSA